MYNLAVSLNEAKTFGLTGSEETFCFAASILIKREFRIRKSYNRHCDELLAKKQSMNDALASFMDAKAYPWINHVL